MDDYDSALLKKITELRIGSEGDRLTFLARLARENGWSHSYAKRCILEYKRFIYLAATSATPMTPSDQVDQVWHLHLTYTESYWHELCGAILKRPLHHGPTRGGSKEAIKYKAQYQSTLDRYHQVFNEKPPSDIWLDSHRRFENADRFIRLNTSEYLLIKKKPFLPFAAISVLPIFLAACVKSDVDPIGLGLFVLLCFIVFYVFHRLFSGKSKRNRNNLGCSGGGCSGNNGNDGGDSGCSGCGGCGG